MSSLYFHPTVTRVLVWNSNKRKIELYLTEETLRIMRVRNPEEVTEEMLDLFLRQALGQLAGGSRYIDNPIP